MTESTASSPVRHRLAHKALGTIALRMVAIALMFVTSVLLARLLGAERYGAYTYAFTWVALLTIPAKLGLDLLVVRLFAAYPEQSQWGKMHGLLRWSTRATWMAALMLAVCGALLAMFLVRSDDQLLGALLVGMAGIPLTAVSQLRQSAMQGLHRVVIGRVPETIIAPLVFLGCIGLAHLTYGARLNAPAFAALNVFATGVAFVLGTLLLKRCLPDTLSTETPIYAAREWLASSLPLMLLAGLQLLNSRIDVIVVGALMGSENVGIYNVALRGAELLFVMLTTANVAFASTIAGLHASGDNVALQRVVTRGSRIIFAIALPPALILIFCGKWFLALFGGDFTRGAAVLSLLTVAQVIHAGASLAGLLLVMTNHERDAVRGMVASMIANLILCLVLVPRYGSMGAALASTIAIVIWVALLARIARRRLGIRATILG